ncbi:CAP domain-containing protein [Paracoccus chinensis]|uniref:CAP domain-containing protein n=1 Tax=Paracoccus chinensis TaxID=525640 RepID=UPI00316AE7C4
MSALPSIHVARDATLTCVKASVIRPEISSQETFTMIPVTGARLYPVLVILLGTAACTAPPAGENASAHDVQASAPGAAQCASPGPAEQAAGVRATNAARASAGLAPVRANSTLARAAAAHACDMAQRGRMTHTGTSTSGPAQRIKSLGYAPSVTAENIAAGPYNAEQALAAWTASSGHLSNILVPQLRDVGIGHAIGSDGRTVYWAAVYAAPR